METKNKLSLYAWLVKEENEIFKNTYQAKQFVLTTLGEDSDDNVVIHAGDCTNQNYTCSLCLVNTFLDDYYDYCKTFK